MTIVVIGKSGQLASELRTLNDENRDQKLIFLGRNDIDLFEFEPASNALSQIKPTAIINASAYTAVDAAENDQHGADLLNHVAVKHLAEFCAQHSIHLTHISTDYVFAGDKGSPYLPADKTEPQGEYGLSKMRGEQAIMDINGDNSVILRTSWVYSIHGNNFVKTMLRLMKEKPELGVIDDQIGSPTWAKGLAEACLTVSEKQLIGIHHYTDSGVASWYDFAIAIQTLSNELGILNKSIPIKPIPSSAYPTPAKRPSYSVMSKKSLIESSGVEPIHWQAQLKNMLKELTTVETK